MKVTVYSQPACGQCLATYLALDAKGINYNVIDVSADEQAAEFVKGLGYMSAPVVVTDDEHWTGFRIDKIAALSQRLVAQQ